MHALLKYLLLSLACCLAIRAGAQRFPFYNLNIENGLTQSQATCMTQDRYGNLWIGTLGGLSRYDGRKFTNYTVSDGLLANSIHDIRFDTSGQLIISSSGGIQGFYGQEFRTLQSRHKNKQIYTAELAISRHNSIYYLYNGSLYTTTSEQALHSRTYGAIQCGNGLLKLAAQPAALYLFPEDQPSRCVDSAFSKDPELSIIRIFEDSRKQIWLLCNKGLYYRKGKELLPFKRRDGQGINFPLFSATEDSSGNLWLGSLSGAFRLKLGQDTAFHYFSKENGLSSNIIYAVRTDKEGNVWLASDGQGIFRYSGGPFISIDASFGLQDPQVTAITGAAGSLYFGSYSGKISRYIPGKQLQHLDVSGQITTMISGMVLQGDKLWIGTHGQGLFCYEHGRLRKTPLSNLHPFAYSFSSMILDSRNRLWAAMAKDLVCIDDKSTAFISLEGNTALALAEIGPDSIIIACNKGFMLLHNGSPRRWYLGNIADSMSAQCMSSYGPYLCIGSAENGILRYNRQDHSLQVINKKSGLSSDFVYNLIHDSSGHLWAGTGLGICRISFGSEGQYQIRHYGKAHGVAGLESNSNAVYRTAAGQIWFGTTGGVSAYIPSARTTTARPVSIVLESVRLFGGKKIDPRYYHGSQPWYQVPSDLELPYRFNNISFAFQAITLSPTDNLRYRYQLEGSHIPWSEWSGENTINISSLEPGTYTLRVECSADGTEKAQAALSYRFRIKTPFHKSAWFLVSIFGTAILTGVCLQYAAQHRRQRRLRREATLRKEEQNRVRERTAEDFHDEVGNKLTRINILTNILRSKIKERDADAERLIAQIQDNTQQLYSGTRDILWSLQPAHDNLYEINNHIRDLAAELFADTDCTFTLSGNQPALSSYTMPLDKSRNYIMIWKEALNNCLKYAAAQQVNLNIKQHPDGSIDAVLTDDGKGFDIATVKKGNGLKNMQARAARMGATLELHSSNKGTSSALHLPAI